MLNFDLTDLKNQVTYIVPFFALMLLHLFEKGNDWQKTSVPIQNLNFPPVLKDDSTNWAFSELALEDFWIEVLKIFESSWSWINIRNKNVGQNTQKLQKWESKKVRFNTVSHFSS